MDWLSSRGVPEVRESSSKRTTSGSVTSSGVDVAAIRGNYSSKVSSAGAARWRHRCKFEVHPLHRNVFRLGVIQHAFVATFAPQPALLRAAKGAAGSLNPRFSPTMPDSSAPKPVSRGPDRPCRRKRPVRNRCCSPQFDRLGLRIEATIGATGPKISWSRIGESAATSFRTVGG